MFFFRFTICRSVKILPLTLLIPWGLNTASGCGASSPDRLPDGERMALNGAPDTDYPTIDAARRNARTAIRLWQESRAQLRFNASDLDDLEIEFPVGTTIRVPETQSLYRTGASGAVQPFFMDGFRLTQAGKDVIRLVSEAESHGFDDQGYYESELKCKLEKLENLSGFDENGLDAALTADDQHLVLATSNNPVVPTNPDQFEQFAQVHLPTLWRKMEHIKPVLSERGQLVRQADFLLTRAFARILATYRKDQAEKKEEVVTVDEIRDGIANPDATISAMLPWTQQYTDLRRAYIRYRQLAMTGSVQPLRITKPHHIKARYVGDEVIFLRERLAAEGYTTVLRTDTPANVFDDSLVDALGLYQADHQLAPTGKLDAATLKVLNVSMETRAAQIAVALRQWRRSKLNQDNSKVIVQVNIPAFEAHFFSNRELKRTHRVVVGNNGWVHDKIINKKGFLNRTGLMTSAIQTVILNPAWRVPPRIKQDELDKEHANDPTYYERHNFVVTTNPDGTESVMQRPGPGNALGVVKMAFPNDQGIYMHDTAQKEYFERPVRAFSHGCVRLQNPIDAAAFLLEQDGSHASGKEQEILRSRKETEVRLNTPIPIHIEYIPVSVNELGRVLFHTDIYSMLGKPVAEMQTRLFNRPAKPVSQSGTDMHTRCAENKSPELDAKAVD